MFTVHSHATYRIPFWECSWTLPEYKAWQYHMLCDQLPSERASVTSNLDPTAELSFQAIDLQ
jgi:hypothetical protein